MALSQNAELLRDSLESAQLLENRYSNFKLVNVNATTGEKRGCFSLVFKAYDELEKKSVAVKFYDPDPAWLLDTYRVAAFRREHEILQQLVGSERCLQLVSKLSVYQLELNVDGKTLSIPCEYFVVDWLDEEIDDYFFSGNKYSGLEKLRLLFEVLLAVEALHRHKIFHRDLKADNLRAFLKAARKLVVAIDLGTAARFDSGVLMSPYGTSVGARGYASPEAICGLAGNRKIAPFNDHYAIGCLLFELFNPDLFYRAIRNTNVGFDMRLGVMRTELLNKTDDESQVQAWHAALEKLGGGTNPVRIDGVGSSVPSGVASTLNELLGTLTNIDYRKRSVNSSWARLKLLSAIKALENEALYQKKLSLARERRKRREQAAAAKADRLARYLRERGQDGNA